MKVAESGTMPRSCPLNVWPSEPDDPDIDPAIEERLVRLHGQGSTTLYGTMWHGGLLWLADITEFPPGTNPEAVRGRKLKSGIVVRIVFRR